MSGPLFPPIDPQTFLPPAKTVEALRVALANAGGGDGAFNVAFPTPSATWTITHNLGRRPSVELYVGGVAVDADVTSTTTTTTVTWPEPTAGEAVIV